MSAIQKQWDLGANYVVQLAEAVSCASSSTVQKAAVMTLKQLVSMASPATRVRRAAGWWDVIGAVCVARVLPR